MVFKDKLKKDWVVQKLGTQDFIDFEDMSGVKILELRSLSDISIKAVLYLIFLSIRKQANEQKITLADFVNRMEGPHIEAAIPFVGQRIQEWWPRKADAGEAGKSGSAPRPFAEPR